MPLTPQQLADALAPVFRIGTLLQIAVATATVTGVLMTTMYIAMARPWWRTTDHRTRRRIVALATGFTICGVTIAPSYACYMDVAMSRDIAQRVAIVLQKGQVQFHVEENVELGPIVVLSDAGQAEDLDSKVRLTLRDAQRADTALSSAGDFRLASVRTLASPDHP